MAGDTEKWRYRLFVLLSSRLWGAGLPLRQLHPAPQYDLPALGFAGVRRGVQVWVDLQTGVSREAERTLDGTVIGSVRPEQVPLRQYGVFWP